MTNRLGPLIEPSGGRQEARLRRSDHLVEALFDRLPRADLIRQTLHPSLLSWLPFHRRGFEVTPAVSYVLDDLTDLDAVWNGVSGQTRRVIGKAAKALHVVEDDSAANLRPMVEATFRRQRLDVPFDVGVVERLVAAAGARERVRVLSAWDDNGALHASMFCVWDDERAWYLGGGGDPELRSSGAGSLLMWRLIQEASKHVTTFDFEGSMLPAVERYFRNFGGRQETCFTVTRTSTRFSPIWSLAQRFRAGRRSKARP